MNTKSTRIAALVGNFHDGKSDAHYAGYFLLFNQQKFYEAHDVLEHIWLQDRHGPNGAFFKGLIQLAGAFVHLQKNRLRPAAALFKLAEANLEKYPEVHERLNVAAVLVLIAGWRFQVEMKDFIVNPLSPANVPQLALQK